MKRSGPRIFKPKSGKHKGAIKQWCETLTVESLTEDGRGLARRDGKVVFLDGALAGEVVVARSIRQSSRFDEARVTEVVEPAADRVEPACKHYRDCGGCQLQHLDFAAQLTHKSRRFADMLSRLGSDIQPDTPILSSQWHYRHRIRLHFARGKLGLRQQRSSEIIEIPDCLIVSPALKSALGELYRNQDFLMPLHSGEIEMAEGDAQRVVCQLRLLKRPTQAVIERTLESFPLALAEIRAADTVLWSESSQLRYPGTSWYFEPGDFTQVNVEVNRQIVEKVGSWLSLKPEDCVVDAFAGLGNFSLALAASGADITGLEVSEVMVDRAAENAVGFTNVKYRVADLFADSPLLPRGINKVLLDPPRAGAQSLCRKLANIKPGCVVYVSCDPATLERDAKLLLEAGYSITGACWADMFPNSHHLESILRFSI